MALPFVRKLANLDRYSLARANAGIYFNVVVGTRLRLQSDPNSSATAPLKIPTETAQWVELLAGPLTWLIQKHPTLSVVVGDHLGGEPKFLRMPTVDITRIIRVTSIQHRNDITQVLEREHSLPFDLLDTQVPLWRIIVVHVQADDTFFLLHVYLHVIGDGRSGMGLTQQLVERLNLQVQEQAQTQVKTPLSTVVVAPTAPLPPPLEERVRCSPGVITLAKAFTTGLLLPASVKKAIEPKYWGGECDATLEGPVITQMAIWYLTREETKQLIQVAKTRKTTVQSILYSASCFAMKAVYLSHLENEHEPKTSKDKIVFATPVSLRPLLSPPISAEVQGNFVSEIMTKGIHVKLDTEFWDLTNAYRDQVVKATSTKKGVQDLLEHTGLLEYLPNHPGGWEDFVRDYTVKELHGRLATIKLSNLGKGWDQSTSAPASISKESSSPESTSASSTVVYKIEDAVFSQSSCITCSAVTLNAATANGVLSMTCVWHKQTFKDREQVELFMKEFKRMVLQAIEPERKEYLFRDALLSSAITSAGANASASSVDSCNK
ncbi:hypothetical protein BX616_003774 [Lobosporangium transversale]|uniref:Alcohol acetyltransferase-domain-containing protein n=1 Tax=Lobosporangium transversale TaxID=64571 RepID=A0A1Y2GMJ0_9FUNG|nr:alcohol acetyltransferase-domain-containing protein [Lobosporangium transversale]KAF9898643.1 hypothetical protein BX616_003774 [Lobosporangium transversale]ORZ13423.1 alcohol acetyltransferase-domain-containing protein [Lobosporangium transversale]|eukprot:XP_021880504.1 alcohol acetyltransferase-domain-containing protein [Lobosporangium transversale]